MFKVYCQFHDRLVVFAQVVRSNDDLTSGSVFRKFFSAPVPKLYIRSRKVRTDLQYRLGECAGTRTSHVPPPRGGKVRRFCLSLISNGQVVLTVSSLSRLNLETASADFLAGVGPHPRVARSGIVCCFVLRAAYGARPTMHCQWGCLSRFSFFCPW